MLSKWLNRLLWLLGSIVILVIVWTSYLYNLIPHRQFLATDFGITEVKAYHDENNNGVDDLKDILQGAKAEISAMPTYRSAYYEGGYPPEHEGVCTDVIWRALNVAGYDFKAMMDVDIAKNLDAYEHIQTPDANIDFRRVPNVKAYLERHAQRLETILSNPEEWQAGDIVVFSSTHIGICSDIRNSKGFPFLLHNGNLPIGEEDCLAREAYLKGITGHYRFIIHDEKEK